MKNSIKKLTVLLIVALPMFSCEDFLEENTRGRISQDDFIFETEDDLRLGVVGLYDVLNDQSLYGFNLGIIGELGTDTYTTGSNNADFEPLDNYTLSDTYNSSANVWAASYKGIARVNYYLDAARRAGIVGTDTIIDQSIKDAYLGEAYCLRALLYFNLVRFFGDIPLATTPSESLSQEFYAAPQEDVYDQIIEDLKFAKNILPIEQNLTGRATKGAAHGLLIKVYLTMAGAPLNKGLSHFKLALAEAEEFVSLSDGGTYPYALLNSYPKVFSEINENNSEIVFDAQSIAGILEGSRWGKWGGYGATPDTRKIIDNAGFGTPRVMKSFYETYSDEDVIRKRWNATDSTYTDNGTFRRQNTVHLYSIAKFRPDPKSFSINGFYSDTETPLNIPILRFDDVLLMAAEAENEVNGPTSKALNYLNRIRSRVGLTGYTGTNFLLLYPSWQFEDAGLDLSDPRDRFREAIFWERGWELCYEGHRRNDLVRWNRLIPTVRNVVRPDHEAINNTLNTNLKVVSNINIKDHHVLFPIPLEELGVSNNKFKQNDNY